MEKEFFNDLLNSYKYENAIQVLRAMRSMGMHIASGRATDDECQEGIDSFVTAASSSSNPDIRLAAATGFQEVFMSEHVNGPELIDETLQNSEVFHHLEKSQKAMLTEMLQEATNQYPGTRRESPIPKLDNYKGRVFQVSFTGQDKSRKLRLTE